MRRTERFAWTHRLLSHEMRVALFFAHRYPRGSEERREMADCLRRTIAARRQDGMQP